MSGIFVDLHTHSTASDGTDTPSKLIEKAAALGLCAIALTDHDTLKGLDEAATAATRHSIELIRGCEIAVKAPGGEQHLLGLWMPHKSSRMEAALAAIRTRRETRNVAMLTKLQELGITVSMEEVAACAHGGAIGRPHIACALQKKGHVSNTYEAFEQYLGWGQAAFVPRVLSSPQEGIRLLAEEGVTVVLAHPCQNSEMTKEQLDDMLADFRSWGLAAIEAYHSTHDNAAIRLCLSLAQKHNLLISGGSDYHGGIKPGIALGVCKAGARVPVHLLNAMKEQRKQQGLWV